MELPDELQLVGDASGRRLLDLARSLTSQTIEDSWAVLVGGGISAGSGVPGWEAFLREAGQRLDIAVGAIADDNYPRLAQDCEDADADAFWALAEQRLCGDHEPYGAHDLLVRLPFQLFLTTNFDCLLEGPHASVRAAEPRRIAFPDLQARLGGDGRLVYLHGRCDCDQPSGNRMDRDRIVFTLSAYDDAYQHQSGPLPLFIQSVFSDMRVLLAGFSLSDFPMRRLLESVRQASESQGRAGGAVAAGRHLAIVPTEAEPTSASDYEFRGLTYGVEPIYYFNPRGGKHEPLLAILEWLSKATAAGAATAAPSPQDLT